MGFTAKHFSIYAVGYRYVCFADVTDTAWYRGAVTFLAARGITRGTGADRFSPDAALTRGQFITLAMRVYGISPDENPSDNFADAGNAYYTGYLASAKRLGISDGVGNNLYAPERAITRQEMFTLLYNTLRALECLPEGGDTGKELSDFSDTASIALWAEEAISRLVKAGKISGDNGKLTPLGRTTRAEMAQVLYNLLAD